MSFKVGDKVRVRKDLKMGPYVSKSKLHINGAVPSMLYYKGQIATITKVSSVGAMRIDLDEEKWGWVDTMFEDEEITNKIKEGVPIHCDTKEKGLKLLKMLDKQGIKWASGDRLIPYNCWDTYRKKTCYTIRNGRLLFWNIDDLNSERKEKLVKFEDLFKEEKEEKPKREYEVIYEKPSFIHQEEVVKVIKNNNCIIVYLKTGERGLAKCSPEDEFNLATGYHLAYTRAKEQYHERFANKYKDLSKIISQRGGK